MRDINNFLFKNNNAQPDNTWQKSHCSILSNIFTFPHLDIKRDVFPHFSTYFSTFHSTLAAFPFRIYKSSPINDVFITMIDVSRT